jgi:hypothetical protein
MDNPWLSAGMEDGGEETALRLIVRTVHIAPAVQSHSVRRRWLGRTRKAR